MKLQRKITKKSYFHIVKILRNKIFNNIFDDLIHSIKLRYISQLYLHIKYLIY